MLPNNPNAPLLKIFHLLVIFSLLLFALLSTGAQPVLAQTPTPLPPARTHLPLPTQDNPAPVHSAKPPVIIPTIFPTAITAGGYHTCLLANGGAKCWGFNVYGQLGNNSNTDTSTPADVTNLTSGVSAISAGYTHTCAVTTTGGAQCWGANGFGQVGDASTTDRKIPVNVSGLTSGVSAISAGFSHTCALTTTGGVKCWGDNGAGELGNGTFDYSNVPVDVSGLTSGVSAVSSGYQHTCALTTTGGVKCWGLNLDGELGNGSSSNSNIPVDVTGLTSGASSVAAGFLHSCVLTTSGAVKCWGFNAFGELGNSTNSGSNQPVDVTGLDSGVTSLSAGDDYTCAVAAAGAVKCWGYNGLGELGNSTNANTNQPSEVSGLSFGGKQVTSSLGDHNCALTSSGALCWGYNGYGQLGNGSTYDSNVPVQVTGTDAYAAVQSITLVDPNPTALGSVDFTVTFTKPVSGVVASDFAITQTGLSGTSVTNVSGSGATYTVTVGTGTGLTGSLRLDLLDDDTILDVNSNPLGGPGTGNGNFNTGETYNILKNVLASGINDDTNADITYTGTWGTSGGTGAYNNTLHYSTTPGDSASVNFTGQQISLSFTRMTDRGILDVYIDDVKVTSLDENGSPQWQRFWVSNVLSSGSHTLRLVHASGAVVDLDAITVTTTAATYTDGSYDDTDAGLIYSSKWTAYTTTGPSSGTLHYSLTPLEFIQFSFTGQQFSLSYTQMTDRGVVDVYVDDVKVASVDENGTGQWQRFWLSDVFPSGLHNVRLVHASGTVVDLDAIHVTGTAPVLTTGTYDDTDAAWTFSKNWSTFTGSGPYNNSLHFSLTPKEFTQFSFTGQQFILTYTQMTDRGVLDVYVDGVKVNSLNENGSPQWQRSWISDIYASGTHTVRLVHASGTVVDVDSVQIYGTAPTLASGMSDDASGSIFYTTKWVTTPASGAYGGDLHYSLTPNEYAQFSFTGQQFTLYYTRMTDRGVLDIYIDGVKVTSLNENGSPQWQRFWASDVMASGQHTVKLVHASGTVVDIDAIGVTTASPTYSAGTYDDADAGLLYSNKWATQSVTGPYNGGLHFSVNPQEFVQFSFTGQQFSFAYTQMTDRGVVDVYVDDVKVASVNENGAPQWQHTWTSDAYASGLHNVKLVHASGAVVDFDSLKITSTAAVLGSGQADDADPAWIYSSQWQTSTGTGPYLGTLHFSQVPNETAQISFTGTQFTLTYTQMTDRGTLDVYVDGVLVATINENGSPQWQHTWTSASFAAGTHTVRFIYRTGSVVDIDSITVAP